MILIVDDGTHGPRPDLVDLAISGSLFVAGLGLARRRRWAWVLGMTIGSVALLSGTLTILDLGSSTTTRLWALGLLVAPGGVLVAILLRRDVRRSVPASPHVSADGTAAPVGTGFGFVWTRDVPSRADLIERRFRCSRRCITGPRTGVRRCIAPCGSRVVRTSRRTVPGEAR